jgi:probable selenium-dependent hydroxylase accessory protein YqeC
MRLIDVLEAGSGLVCAVGAGGKKTTLYHLASAHVGRVGLTSTVAQAPFPATLDAQVVVAPAPEIVRAVIDAAAQHRFVAFALPSQKRARHAGVPLELLAEIRREARFDVLLVKSDGARMRWIKAPEEGEPVLPEDADTVIPIVSARAIGRPLGEDIAHRPHRISLVAGVKAGDLIEPEHVGRLLAAENGALKDTGAARVRPVLNMVDDLETLMLAREAAHAALRLTDRFDRVALTTTGQPDRLLEIVTR